MSSRQHTVPYGDMRKHLLETTSAAESDNSACHYVRRNSTHMLRARESTLADRGDVGGSNGANEGATSERCGTGRKETGDSGGPAPEQRSAQFQPIHSLPKN
jgi:hypothetical protein